MCLAVAGHPARADSAHEVRRRDPVLAAAGHVAERRRRVGNERVDIDVAGNADDDVCAGVLLLHVGRQLGAGETPDVGAGADHRTGHRVLAVAGFVEQPERGRQCIVLVLGVLVQDDLSLALELGFGKGAVADDVAQHVHEGSGIPWQAVHVERGMVLVGVGVDLGAQALGIEVDLLAVA